MSRPIAAWKRICASGWSGSRPSTSRLHPQKGLRVTTFVEPIRRSFDRTVEQARPISIQPGTMLAAEGSATISIGNTVVLCAATVEERVPKWITERGGGWVPAEYGMLPRATKERTRREAAEGKQ